MNATLDKTLSQIEECFNASVKTKSKQHKLSPLQLLAFIVTQGFSKEKNLSLEGIRRNLPEQMGIKLAKSSFWERLNAKVLHKMLYTFLAWLMAHFSKKTLGNLNLLNIYGATGIVMFDSTIISLWDSLSKKFPGTFTHSSIKLNFSFDLVKGVMNNFDYSAGKIHDNIALNFNLIIKAGVIYLFDLGYWDYNLFYLIDKSHAYFLSRVKSGSTFYIIDVVTGASNRVIGKTFKELSKSFKRKREDLVVLGCSMEILGETFIFKLVGFWNPNKMKYHWYITNLEKGFEKLSILYRLRWQIEIFFKAAKSVLRIDELPSGKEMIILNLIFAKICAQFLSTIIFTPSIKSLSSLKKNQHPY